MDAVEVGDDRVHVDRAPEPRRARERRDRAGDLELVDGVDLDRRRRVDLDDAHPAEEAVPGGAEGCGIHHIEAAGLEEVRFAVLPARPMTRVVVHAVGRAGRVALPQEAVRLHGREHRIERALRDETDAVIQRPRIDERRCGLQERQDPDIHPLAFERSERRAAARSRS